MDSIWDQSINTAVLILCVYVGRPYFRPNFSFCHDFPSYDFTYDIRLTHLTTHSFIPHLARAATRSSAWSITAPHDAHLLVRNDRSTHCFSAAILFLSLTRMRLQHLRTGIPCFALGSVRIVLHRYFAWMNEQ